MSKLGTFVSAMVFYLAAAYLIFAFYLGSLDVIAASDQSQRGGFIAATLIVGLFYAICVGYFIDESM